MTDLPEYRSHKVVRAGMILEIGTMPSESGTIRLYIDDAFIEVTAAYMEKHKPQIGGYYVLYSDGYASWSPAEAFEEGYTQMSSDTDKAPVQRPSRGRIVQYNDDPYPNPERAAGDDSEPDNWIVGLIYAVHSDEVVSMVAWDEHGNQAKKSSIEYGDGRYNWRWPPRV